MSEEKTAPNSGTPEAPETPVQPVTPVAPESKEQTPTPAPEPKESPTDVAQKLINEGKYSDARKVLSGVRSELRKEKPADKAEKLVEKPKETPAKEQAPAETPRDSKGKYTIKTKNGKDLEYPDEDGHLGYKNVDGLKKAFANNQNHLNATRGWMEDERRQRIAAEQELSRLRAELDKKKEQPSPAAPKVEQQAQQAISKFEVKPLPKMPDGIPVDPIDRTPEQQKAFADWQQEYQKVTNENISGMAAQISNLDPAIQQSPAIQAIIKQNQELMAQLNSITPLVEDIKNTKKQAEEEAQENRLWEQRKKIQATNPDFATPTDIRELDKQIAGTPNSLGWMDMVAQANSVRNPGVGSPSYSDYYSKRGQLVQAYLNGDPAIVGACEAAGVVPPDGYENYFKMATYLQELTEARNRYINQGVFSSNSTLEDAMIRFNHENGVFPRQIVNMERQARAEGADTVLNALKKHQTEHAAVVPPNSSASGAPVALFGNKIESLNEKIRANPNDAAARKELRDLRKQISSIKPAQTT